METLKSWKQIDIWGQAVMLAAPLLWSLFTRNIGYLAAALFTVGGWQVISCLVHLTLMKEWWISGSRVGYNIVLLAIVIIGLLNLVVVSSGSFRTGEGIIYELLGLAVLGVVLAVWYFSMSVSEWRRLKQARTPSEAGILDIDESGEY